MICPKCGNQIIDGAKFCTRCGYNISLQNRPLSKFNKNIVFIFVGAILLLFLFVKFLLPNITSGFSSAKMLNDQYGNEYFLGKDGNQLFNQWLKYKNKEYHVNDSGLIDKSQWIDVYYVGEDGAKVKNDWVQYDSHWYYLKNDGVYARDEVLEIEKKLYAFNENGDLLYNFFINPKDKSKWSFADTEGALLRGEWYKDPMTGYYYYLDNDGYLLVNGIYEIDRKKYALDENGVLIVNRFFNDFMNPQKFLFANESGEVIRNEGFINFLGVTYFLDKDGYLVLNCWFDFDGNTYFALSSGIIAKATWLERSYYVDAEGRLLRNTTTPDGYSVDSDGKIIGKLRSEKSNRYTMKFLSSDVSEYPKIKLYYKIYDSAGNVKSGFNIYEVTINEKNNQGAYVTRVVNAGEIIQKKHGLSISLIADRSTSLSTNDLTKIKSAMKRFVSSMDFSVGDRGEVLSFGSDIKNVCAFTNNVSSLNNGINSISLDGATALYDAIYRGISHAARQSNAKCVVVFTDGYDNRSTNTPQSIVNYSLQLQVPVYIIGVGSSIDVNSLMSIANGSGGKYWNIDNVGQLDRAYTDVYTEGKNTYYIEYITDTTTGSQYSPRNIQIKIDDGMEYVELVNNFTPVNPNTIAADIDVSDNNSNSNNSSVGSSNNVSSGFTMSYGTKVNKKIDVGSKTVKIEIRRPRIDCPHDFDMQNRINGAVGSAMQELVDWCEDYARGRSTPPKSITIENCTLESANNSSVVVKMTGKAINSGSANVNISFRLTINCGSGTYSLSKL